MPTTCERHLTAIRAGAVTQSNLIGIRKLLNAAWRKDRGYSLSRTSPLFSEDDITAIEQAIHACQPRIVGDWHDSGAKLLRSKHYAKRLTSVADIIADLTEFRLVGFEEFARGQHVALYRAIASDGRSFTFRNVAWQSGGDGPELV